ncbi:MAG: bacillithiol biosynthesis cysteine-adding enzyme BshC [Chitinophagaceae bacterium]
MECTRQELELKETGFFSEIVTNYAEGNEKLRPYYTHTPDRAGIEAAIKERITFQHERTALADELHLQYKVVAASDPVHHNIELLREQGTFTITTAHQPNIFTGYLYFVYKILHTVKLAAAAKEWFPQYNFVPVYYMGSEDADLDELGKIFIDGDKMVWNTAQTGAVGRMQPKGLETLIDQLNGRLSVFPHGKELIALLKRCYLESDSIQTATFKLVHALFQQYGVVVFIPDNPVFKKLMIPVFKEDLLQQKASGIVGETIEKLEQDGFKVQAQPREINLFYLDHQTRERIVKENDHTWHVLNTGIYWNEAQLLETLEAHPERFSPNVILRGLMQETILPNIAFIGGGGELAYWLEYKSLFEAFQVPFPVLLLRNSFLVVPKQVAEKMRKNGIEMETMFRATHEVLAEKAIREADGKLSIETERKAVTDLYQQMSEIASAVDATLAQHVSALETKAQQKLEALQKKIIRAEKRKHDAFARQYEAVKSKLFPNGNLQERTDNLLPYLAEYGPDFIEAVYTASPVFCERFVILHLPS